MEMFNTGSSQPPYGMGQSRRAKHRRSMREFHARQAQKRIEKINPIFHWNRERKRLHRFNPPQFFHLYPDAPGAPRPSAEPVAPLSLDDAPIHAPESKAMPKKPVLKRDKRKLKIAAGKAKSPKLKRETGILPKKAVKTAVKKKRPVLIAE